MSKLRPMLKNDATDAEKWLLRSAQLDVPPASGKRRALATLGLAAAATTTASASGVAAAATASAGWVIKCIAVGAIGGVVVAGAVEGVSALVPESPHALSPALTTSAMAVSHASAPRAPVASPVEPSLADPGRPLEHTPDVPDQTMPVPPPAQTPQRAQAVAARVEPSPALSPDQRPRPMETTLAQEVSALDEARRALASGNVERAVNALDAYELHVVTPRLRPEATVLRIEALLLNKQFDRARQLGEQLLAKDPDGAYAQHVRSLLADAAR